MPPKAKFTREEIIGAAYEIARTEGMDRITARELGQRLGSSARPIFTVFESMEQIKEEVLACAKASYKQYVTKGLQMEKAFQGVGIAYITFAMEEPKLFQLLFMSARPKQIGVDQILPHIDESYEKILQSVQVPHQLSRQTADIIYQHLWTYTHGIATMCATGLCQYTMEQIIERMAEIFKGLLMIEKGGYLGHDKD